MTRESDDEMAKHSEPTGLALAPSESPEGEHLWMSLVVALLRHPRLLLALPLLGMMGFTVWARLTRGSYVAESQFLPQGAEGQANLAGAFGFLTRSGGAESVDFYLTLLSSRQLLGEVALTSYRFESDARTGDSLVGNIIDLYEIEAPTREQRLLSAVGTLDGIVVVDVERGGVVKIEVTTWWPGLSELVNRRLLDLTSKFNMERRQSQAAAERRFVEGRMRERQEELEEVENQLERFLDRNRSYESSPQLQFAKARLERRVSLAQQVFTTLSQAYEQARIDEVRNTPVVTIVDPPEGSARGAAGPVRGGAIGLILGLGLAVVLAVAMEFIGRLREQDVAEFKEAEDLLRSMPRNVFATFSGVRTRLGGK